MSSTDIGYASLSITCFCALVVIYPYIIYPLILKLMPSRPTMKRELARKPRVSLVFCAYNEAAMIESKIENLLALKRIYPNLECLAYDDTSTDATYELLSRHRDVVTTLRSHGRTGKAHGMKLLVAQSSGEILVFTDANVTLKEDAIERIVERYGDPTVGGVCGTLNYIGADHSVTAKVGSAYWRLEEYLKSEESRTGNVMGADGSIFSIRRRLYPDFPDTVLDDLTVSMAAVFAGMRLIRAPEVIAYERLVADRNDEFSRKIRIASRAFHTHKILAPQLRNMQFIDKFKYMSRKYIRWFGAVFLGLGVAFGCLTLWTVWPGLPFLALAALALLLYAGATRPLGPISSVSEIVLALVATFIGILRAMAGKTVVTWNPAKSRS